MEIKCNTWIRYRVKELLALLLVFSTLSTSAYATSIFDLLPDEGTSSVVALAPSYGNMSGTEPDAETKNIQNDTIVTYKDVSAKDVNRFGQYLGQRNYAVIEQQTQGSQYGYRISDGNITFSMVYDNSDHSLNLIYPEGTEWEPIAFPGYKRIYLGETVNIDGLGEFTFNSFSMSEAVTNIYDRSYHYGDYEYDKYSFRGAFLSFSYYNSTSMDKFFHSAEKRFSVDKHNPLFDEELQYIVDGNKYPATSDNMGKEWSNYTIYSHLAKCEAAKTTDLCLAYRLEDRISSSTDGTIGITFAFHNGHYGNYPKYVLVLRENGKNLY